jgi:hypothetical protein
MFVRWKRRRCADKRWYVRDADGEYCDVWEARFLLSAVLVRSERRGGKPRQKVVAHLGGIRENDLDEVMPRSRFWSGAAAKLNGLGLDPDARDRIDSALATKVIRPDQAEVDKAGREFQERLAELTRLLRGCR